MSLVRAFIALEIPKPILENIQTQTKDLRENINSSLVRWVPFTNIHLTVKFLGDVPQANLVFVKQMLTHAAKVNAPFDIQLTHLGSFPTPGRPRVLWIGIQAPAALEALHQSIEIASNRLGYTPEPRAFSPHLTLGRVRPNLSSAELQKIRETLERSSLQKPGNATIEEIHLYQSDLQPSGSVYKKLFSVSFNKNQ